MFNHVIIGARDMERMVAFYDAFLAPLGISRFMLAEAGNVAGWERRGESGKLFVGTPIDGNPAGTANGSMVAFRAPSREAVVQAYQAALAQGGTDAGAPGLRPQYGPDYFGAYVRDPEGNKLHAMLRVGPRPDPAG